MFPRKIVIFRSKNILFPSKFSICGVDLTICPFVSWHLPGHVKQKGQPRQQQDL